MATPQTARKVLEILAAEPVTVQLATETVTVRELGWVDAIRFITDLSALAVTFLQPAGGTEGETNLQSASQLLAKFDLAKLGEVIGTSSGLVEFLVTRSIGKGTDWLAKQSPLVVLTLLDAALEVNLRPEVLDAGNAVGRRLAAGVRAAPATKATSPA